MLIREIRVQAFSRILRISRFQSGVVGGAVAGLLNYDNHKSGRQGNERQRNEFPLPMSLHPVRLSQFNPARKLP
jgi:hypothetical protein